MAAELVRLQEPRIVTLAMGVGQNETQASVDAANVLPYRFVTPWVRVLRDPANNLTISGVTFDFLSAPCMATPDDEEAIGVLFKDLSYTVTVNNTAILGPTIRGQIFTRTPTDGKIPPIESPGGLLIWKCSNQDLSNPNTLRFEIVLICREF